MQLRMMVGALLGAVLVWGGTPVRAATIDYFATGTGTDGALSASAHFETSAGLLSVTISNELSASQIRSAGQAVSDLIFVLSNPAGTLGSTSASGQLINVNTNGSVTTVAGQPTRWLGDGGGSFSVVGNTVTLEAIGGGQPDQMLLPFASLFTNANSSITGGQFNPFSMGDLTFAIALSGVTAATTITGATFSFGTGPDSYLAGQPSPVPVPAVGAGIPGLIALYGFIMLRRKRRLMSEAKLQAA